MRNIQIFFLLILTFFGGISFGLAAVEPYRVTVNGHESKVQVQQDKDVLLVPITVPVSADAEEWTVTFKRDDRSRKLDVKMNSTKSRLRSGMECYYCSGQGLCANDYPAGSGQNYSGLTESSCNGTGRCYHCTGTGRL